MSIKLPVPGPELRAEAIRAAQARHDQISAGLDKKWWAATVEKLKRIDQEHKAKGR